MKRALIGIMVTKRYLRKKILKQYDRHHHLPIRLIVFSVGDVLLNKAAVKALYRKGKQIKEKEFPFPHVVYNCCFNKQNKIAQTVKVLIGENKFFNTINRLNKWNVFQVLHQSALKQYLPDTLLYQKDQLVKHLDVYSHIYLKPVYGSFGNNVFHVARDAEGNLTVALHTHQPTFILPENEAVKKMDRLFGRKIFLIQQGIELKQLKNQNFDLRALVQKNVKGKWSVTAVTARLAYRHCFNTSLCSSVWEGSVFLGKLYSTEQREAILKVVHHVSIRAAQELENKTGLTGELSVDFALDQESRLWIIELNGKPQKSIYKGVAGLKHKRHIYQKPIEYAYFLSQSPKS